MNRGLGETVALCPVATYKICMKGLEKNNVEGEWLVAYRSLLTLKKLTRTFNFQSNVSEVYTSIPSIRTINASRV